MSGINPRNRPPQENLLQHTFDKYGDDIKNGVVPSSVGDKSRLPQPGRGYNGDGVDDTINIPSKSYLSFLKGSNTTDAPIDFSCWVYFQNDTHFLLSFFGANRGGHIFVGGAGNLNVHLYSSQDIRSLGASPDLLIPNEWNFVRISWSGERKYSAIKYQINENHGSVTSPNPWNYNGISGSTNLAIGRRISLYGSGTIYYPFTITDWKVYTKNLSEKDGDRILKGEIPHKEYLAIHYKCEDTGLIAFDSSGNGNHGTKFNTDILGANTFSYEGSDVPKSYQNEVGYSDGDGSDNNGLYIPRNESNPKFDVLGNPLQYKGQVSYPAKLVESNCLSFDGIDQYTFIENSSLIGYNRLISCRIEPISGTNPIIGFSGGAGNANRRYYIFTTSIGGGKYRIDLTRVDPYGSTSSFNVSLDYGVSYKIGVVFNSSTSATLYVDDVIVDRLDNLTSVVLTTQSFERFHVGCNRGISPTDFFNGKIYDVSVINLSTQNTQLKWNCAEGAGNTVFDASGNNNHATIFNGVSRVKQDVYHHNYHYGFKVLPYNNGTSDQVYPNSSNLASNGTKYQTDVYLVLYTNGNINTGISLYGNSTTTRFTVSTAGCSIRVVNEFSGAVKPNLSFKNNLQYGKKYKLTFIREGINTALYLDGVFQDIQDLSGSSNPNATIPILGDRRIGAGSATYSPRGYLIEKVVYKIDDVIQHTLKSNSDGVIENIETNDLAKVLPRYNGGNINESFIKKPLNYQYNAPNVDLSRVVMYKPSQRNHNGAETKIDFNPYNTPIISKIQNSLERDLILRYDNNLLRSDDFDTTLLYDTDEIIDYRAINFLKLPIRRLVETLIDEDAKNYLSQIKNLDYQSFAATVLLVKELKDENIWNEIEFLFPFIGKSKSDFEVDLVNKQDLIISETADFKRNKVKFNSANQEYMYIPFSGYENMTDVNWRVGYYLNENRPSVDECDLSLWSSGFGQAFPPNTGARVFTSWSGSGGFSRFDYEEGGFNLQSNSAITNTIGLFSAEITDNGDNTQTATFYKNDVSQGSKISTIDNPDYFTFTQRENINFARDNYGGKIGASASYRYSNQTFSLLYGTINNTNNTVEKIYSIINKFQKRINRL